jgi:hypothetical protein
MQHREEAVELSLNAGPVAAEKPTDQCGEVQLAAPAEMPRIGNMTRTQFRRMKVADEPAQYRDNPSSYCQIVRITTFRILPAQPRVYKPLRLKLIGLGNRSVRPTMSDAERLKELEQENSKLKRVLAESMFDLLSVVCSTKIHHPLLVERSPLLTLSKRISARFFLARPAHRSGYK